MVLDQVCGRFTAPKAIAPRGTFCPPVDNDLHQSNQKRGKTGKNKSIDTVHDAAMPRNKLASNSLHAARTGA